MQAIRIGVVRGPSYRSTDGFEVFGDGGSGTMDWVHPMTPRRQMFWPDAPAPSAHVAGGHVMATHLDSVQGDGHLEGTHLLDGWLMPAAMMFYETDPWVFGRFRHAVVTADGVGNATTAGVTVQEMVINSEPPPASGFRPASHDAQTGQLTFSFSGSPRLTG